MMTFSNFREEEMLIQNNTAATTRMFFFEKGEAGGLDHWPLGELDGGTSFSEAMRKNGFFCVEEVMRGPWALEVWESPKAADGYQFALAVDGGCACYFVFCVTLFDLAGCLKTLAPLFGELKEGDGD